jgi:hypothetical protein
VIFKLFTAWFFLWLTLLSAQALEPSETRYVEGRIISLDTASSTGQIKLRNGETITAFVTSYEPMPSYKAT